MTSLVAALGAKFPDSQVLFDDTFDNGFASWQELNGYNGGSPTGVTFAPLSLRHPSVPGNALALQTRSIADPAPQSQCIAMKRLAHYQAPAIVDLEVWFAYGGESTTGFAPRYLHFMVDEMYSGTRRFWKARWRNVNESNTTRSLDWFLSSQGENNYATTGFTSDLPWNGNKGSLSYVKLSIDLAGSRYLSLKANKDTFDLSSVAGITPPSANGDSSFDDPLFNYGLNFMVGVINRGAQPFTGWMACPRIRATVRSA